MSHTHTKHAETERKEKGGKTHVGGGVRAKVEEELEEGEADDEGHRAQPVEVAREDANYSMGIRLRWWRV